MDGWMEGWDEDDDDDDDDDDVPKILICLLNPFGPKSGYLFSLPFYLD